VSVRSNAALLLVLLLVGCRSEEQGVIERAANECGLEVTADGAAIAPDLSSALMCMLNAIDTPRDQREAILEDFLNGATTVHEVDGVEVVVGVDTSGENVLIFRETGVNA
jgi:hypothetical protein